VVAVTILFVQGPTKAVIFGQSIGGKAE